MRPKLEVIDSRSSSLPGLRTKETPKTPSQKKSNTVFPANPIRNLIQIYEGGDSGRQDRGHGQSGEAGVTKGKTTFTRGGDRGGGERTPDTASCVDEFLASASKARSKYQKMLETPPPSPVPPVQGDTVSAPSTSNSPVRTSPVLPVPTTSELADGCFTDVSYAGSFASWQPPLDEDPTGGENTSPMEEESQNINSGTFTEISYAGSFASSKSPSSSNSSSPVQPEKPPTPPPAVPPRAPVGSPVVPASPRHRRRQRREQLLQEHKTLGREIVLTALRKEEKVEVNYAEEKEQNRAEDEKKKRELDEHLLRKMLQEREEEIADLRAACEAWRQKTIASEKDLAEANFTVDKLERFEHSYSSSLCTLFGNCCQYFTDRQVVRVTRSNLHLPNKKVVFTFTTNKSMFN